MPPPAGGRVNAFTVIGAASVAFTGAVLLAVFVDWLKTRWPRRVQTSAVTDVTGRPFPDIRDRLRACGVADADDERDIVAEGLGYCPEDQVRDGHLIPLGRLHPIDQEVFGPARRAP
jgi:hypothetical protein